jgi:predicted flap endonuclease-1-like 5' DNA nuclease
MPRQLNNSYWKTAGDGRLTVVLCLLSGLLLSDFTSSYYPSFLKENKEVNPCEQLHFVKPDMLIAEKCPEAGGGPVPAKYTPFLFEPIPINSADRDMLMTVNGIGPALAGNILLYRQRFGQFETSLDLKNLHGVGPKRAAQLGSVFTFKEEEAP